PRDRLVDFGETCSRRLVPPAARPPFYRSHPESCLFQGHPTRTVVADDRDPVHGPSPTTLATERDDDVPAAGVPGPGTIVRMIEGQPHFLEEPPCVRLGAEFIEYRA